MGAGAHVAVVEFTVVDILGVGAEAPHVDPADAQLDAGPKGEAPARERQVEGDRDLAGVASVDHVGGLVAGVEVVPEAKQACRDRSVPG